MLHTRTDRCGCCLHCKATKPVSVLFILSDDHFLPPKKLISVQQNVNSINTEEERGRLEEESEGSRESMTEDERK